MVGTVILLVLNDTVTRLTEHYGIVLGIVILFFALGLKKGLLDYVTDWIGGRRRKPLARAENVAAAESGTAAGVVP
jgi:branched-chain amino acid transport system permease protein